MDPLDPITKDTVIRRFTEEVLRIRRDLRKLETVPGPMSVLFPENSVVLMRVKWKSSGNIGSNYSGNNWFNGNIAGIWDFMWGRYVGLSENLRGGLSNSSCLLCHFPYWDGFCSRLEGMQPIFRQTHISFLFLILFRCSAFNKETQPKKKLGFCDFAS